MEVLKNGIDTHVHTSPSVIERKLDDLEMAVQAKNAGMQGVVLKAHEGCSCARAMLAQKITGINVYGGLCLNASVGGLNPEAVETSLKMGAKIIWMPTLSAYTHRHFFSSPEGAKLGFSLKGSGEGIKIIDENGKLKDPVCQILELIKQYDAVVATGHVSIDEAQILVDVAIREMAIGKIIYNHPDINFLKVPLTVQKELGRKGVYLEKCCVCTYPPWSAYTAKSAAALIREIGVEQCILSSDLGQLENPYPVDGMKAFLNDLIESGLSDTAIRTMWVDNPNALLS